MGGAFLSYLATRPFVADIHYRQAKKDYAQMKWKEAISELEKAVYLQPHNAEYHSEVAQIYSKISCLYRSKEDLSKAIHHFDLAIKLNPHNAFTHSYLGWTYQENEMYEQAISEMKEAIELDPNNATFHWNLGCFYKVKGKLKEAKEEYEEVLRILPSYSQAKTAIMEINTQIKEGKEQFQP